MTSSVPIRGVRRLKFSGAMIILARPQSCIGGGGRLVPLTGMSLHECPTVVSTVRRQRRRCGRRLRCVERGRRHKRLFIVHPPGGVRIDGMRESQRELLTTCHVKQRAVGRRVHDLRHFLGWTPIAKGNGSKSPTRFQ